MNTFQENQKASAGFRAKCFVSFVCLLAIFIFRVTAAPIKWEEIVLVGLAVLPWFSMFLESLRISKDGVDARFLHEKVNKIEAAINNQIIPLAEEAREIAASADDRISDVSRMATTAKNAALRGVGKKPTPTPPDGKALPVGRSAALVDAEDLQKGRWGGKRIDEENGRRMAVRVEKIKGEDFFRRIIVRVESTAAAEEPLSGEVVFHLHQSFNPPVETAEAVNGVAEIELVAYGAFTVGAEADKGKTRLEYDISEDGKNSDDPFYDR